MTVSAFSAPDACDCREFLSVMVNELLSKLRWKSRQGNLAKSRGRWAFVSQRSLIYPCRSCANECTKDDRGAPIRLPFFKPREHGSHMVSIRGQELS